MTDKTMTLEPCPFCGGDSFVLMIDGTNNFAVVCQYTSEHGCGMRGPYRQTEQEAITAWNTRHLSQPAERVIVDFEKVGSAGPFPVVDGRLQIPAVTVADMIQMAKPAERGEEQEKAELVTPLSDVALIHDLCEAVPDMHPTVRSQLQQLAKRIESGAQIGVIRCRKCGEHSEMHIHGLAQPPAAGVPDGFVLVPEQAGDADAFMVYDTYMSPCRTRKDAYRIAIRKLSERAQQMLSAAPEADHD